MSVVTFPAAACRHGSGTSSKPSPDEGLRLVSAFIKIEAAEHRLQVVELAERFAGAHPDWVTRTD